MRESVPSQSVTNVVYVMSFARASNRGGGERALHSGSGIPFGEAFSLIQGWSNNLLSGMRAVGSLTSKLRMRSLAFSLMYEGNCKSTRKMRLYVSLCPSA